VDAKGRKEKKMESKEEIRKRAEILTLEKFSAWEDQDRKNREIRDFIADAVKHDFCRVCGKNPVSYDGSDVGPGATAHGMAYAYANKHKMCLDCAKQERRNA